MAFVAGAIIGGLITAVIVYAYFYQRISDQEIEIAMLKLVMNNNRVFQDGMIKGLRDRLKVYEEKFGPYQDIIGDEDNEEGER